MSGDVSDGGSGCGRGMGWGATEPQQPWHPALRATSNLNKRRNTSNLVYNKPNSQPQHVLVCMCSDVKTNV